MRVRPVTLLSTAVVAAVVAGCAFAIGSLRPAITERLTEGKGDQDDLYVLPNPDRLAVMSLGYRAALADLLWGHVRAWSGIALFEKRRFTYAGEYLDAINALDPNFRAPYMGSDLLLTFQSVPIPKEDYYKARQILERGVANRPDDSELWLQLAQFVGTLAPPHLAELENEETALAWEADGARYYARACELGASDPKIARFCVAATFLYKKLGDDAALESFLERVLSLTDNIEARARAIRSLVAIRGKRALGQARQRFETLEKTQESDLPFVSRTLYTALAPPIATWDCAGIRSDFDEGAHGAERADCATRWGPYLDERALEAGALSDVPVPPVSPEEPQPAGAGNGSGSGSGKAPAEPSPE